MVSVFVKQYNKTPGVGISETLTRKNTTNQIS